MTGPQPQKPELWVIVPALNEEARIGGMLRALAGQADLDFALVVVDNGSLDSTRRDRAADRGGGAVRGAPDHRADQGNRVRGGHRVPVRGQARREAAGQDRRRLPAVAGLDRRGQGRDVGRAGLVCGRIVARRDEEGPVGRALFRCLVAIATAFGRVRPAHHRRHGYLTPYRMHAGNNMAITTSLYEEVGGMPRQRRDTDRDFLNQVRRHTAAIAQCRAMTVENSTRRLRAYGLRRTAQWYLGLGSGGLASDPR